MVSRGPILSGAPIIRAGNGAAALPRIDPADLDNAFAGALKQRGHVSGVFGRDDNRHPQDDD